MTRFFVAPCRVCQKSQPCEVDTVNGRLVEVVTWCVHEVRFKARRCVDCGVPHGGDWKRFRCEMHAKARHAERRKVGNDRWRASPAYLEWRKRDNERRRAKAAAKYLERYWSDPETHRAKKREWARKNYHTFGAPKREDHLARQRERYQRNREQYLARQRERYATQRAERLQQKEAA